MRRNQWLASTSVLAIDRHVRVLTGQLLRLLGPGWEWCYRLQHWPPVAVWRA